MIQEIELLEDDEPATPEGLSTTTAATANSSEDFMGSQAPLELEIGLDTDEGDSLLGGGTEPTPTSEDYAGSQASLDLGGGESGFSLTLDRSTVPAPASVTAEPAADRSEPAETPMAVEPASAVSLEPVRRRTTRQHAGLTLIPDREKAPRAQVIKGSIVALVAAVLLAAIGFLAFVSAGRPALVGQSVAILQGEATLPSGYPGVTIQSLTGSPLRLLGGQEMLLIKGEVAGNLSATGPLVAEVSLTDASGRDVLATGQAQLGSRYTGRDLREISRSGKIQPAHVKDAATHFELLLPAAALPDTLLGIKQNPARLHLQVSAR